MMSIKNTCKLIVVLFFGLRAIGYAGIMKLNSQSALLAGVSSLTEGGVLLGGGTGVITASAVLTNGQLLIGDGTTAPSAATLTAGSGITVTNGAGTITISTNATTLDATYLNASGDTATGTMTLSSITVSGTMQLTTPAKGLVAANGTTNLFKDDNAGTITIGGAGHTVIVDGTINAYNEILTDNLSLGTLGSAIINRSGQTSQLDLQNSISDPLKLQSRAAGTADPNVIFNSTAAATVVNLFQFQKDGSLLFDIQADGDVGIGVVPTLGMLHLDKGTGVGQATLDGSTGGCIMLRDTDDSGWTECDALDGVLTCSIDADGICD